MTAETVQSAGPFTTRRVWRRADGGSSIWDSRTARRRGVLRRIADRGYLQASEAPDLVIARRLGRLNVVASTAFTAGGLLFALGAAVAQLGSGDPTTSSAIYFAGGLCFNTGGYASLLQAINAPRPDASGELVAGAWRWWSYEPNRIDWLGTFVLFAGTLVFGVNLLDSFLQGLSSEQVNRLIWAPDLIGCALFLISGHLALIELSHGRLRWRPRRDLAWWIVAINQVGSILFAVSALASYTRPATDSVVNVDIANWGTLTGALCFALGGVVQLFERPSAGT